MTDVFVRVNRARGMELLSPEDLVNACKVMREFDGVKRKPKLKMALRKFDESGVMVLQLKTLDEESVIKVRFAGLLRWVSRVGRFDGFVDVKHSFNPSCR